MKNIIEGYGDQYVIPSTVCSMTWQKYGFMAGDRAKECP